MFEKEVYSEKEGTFWEDLVLMFDFERGVYSGTEG